MPNAEMGQGQILDMTKPYRERAKQRNENRTTNIDAQRVNAYDRYVGGLATGEDRQLIDSIYEKMQLVPTDQQPAARETMKKVLLQMNKPHLAAMMDTMPSIITKQEKWAPGSFDEAARFEGVKAKAQAAAWELPEDKTPKAPGFFSQVGAALADRIRGGEVTKRKYKVEPME